jgi:hypothetical protein
MPAGWFEQQEPARQEPARCRGEALQLAITLGRSDKVLGAIGIQNVDRAQQTATVGYLLAPRPEATGT